MLAVKSWLKEFFSHKREAILDTSTGGSGNKSYSQPIVNSVFRVSEDDNSITRLWRHYNCLLLVGKPGVGKTTCIEAICHTEGYSLHSIECSQFETFNDLKKTYSEAVKSKVVDLHPINANGEYKLPSKGTLNSFFTTPNQNPGKENEIRKKYENKVFLLLNFEHFLHGKPDAPDNFLEKVIKNMLEFFEYSCFPFVIETSKSGRNMIDYGMINQFDLIEYTRPDINPITIQMSCLIRIEALTKIVGVKDIKRRKEHDLVPQDSYQSQLQESLTILESLLVNLQTVEISSIFLTLPSTICIQDYVKSVDFNMHTIISNLSYLVHYGSGNGSFSLTSSQLSLVNRQSLDEYRLMPIVVNKPKVTNPDFNILIGFPEVAAALEWKSVQDASFCCKTLLKFGAVEPLSLDHRLYSSLGEFLKKRSICYLDLLDAQEEIYLHEIGKKVNDGLLSCGLRVREPEDMDHFRLLSLLSPRDNIVVDNPFGLRSKVKV